MAGSKSGIIFTVYPLRFIQQAKFQYGSQKWFTLNIQPYVLQFSVKKTDGRMEISRLLKTIWFLRKNII